MRIWMGNRAPYRNQWSTQKRICMARWGESQPRVLMAVAVWEWGSLVCCSVIIFRRKWPWWSVPVRSFWMVRSESWRRRASARNVKAPVYHWRPLEAQWEFIRRQPSSRHHHERVLAPCGSSRRPARSPDPQSWIRKTILTTWCDATDWYHRIWSPWNRAQRTRSSGTEPRVRVPRGVGTRIASEVPHQMKTVLIWMAVAVAVPPGMEVEVAAALKSAGSI